ncbi:hypothetical protein [Nocardia carnea]|uniref:hypothetical protein n=1 Tax=Nocardia carnea TaxID=37328 RepID=UPI0024588F28|nr:hypothetical protein [Nocardia carnea]
MDIDNAPEHGDERQSGTQVDAAQLRRLLASAPDSCLVLSEGRLRIHDDPADDGAGLVVVTRADLVARVGEQPEEAELTTQAALLDSEIGSLGA